MKSLYEFLCGKIKSNKPKPDWRPFTYQNNIDFDKDLPIDFTQIYKRPLSGPKKLLKI